MDNHGIEKRPRIPRSLQIRIKDRLRHSLTELGVLTARPIAFVVFLIYATAWVILDRKSLDWHSVATLATWAMTLFIQRAEHRDTQAIHAKLDELLKVHGEAQNSLMKLDDEDAEEVEHTRDKVKKS
jgi:low affinity Fe/Cu permease